MSNWIIPCNLKLYNIVERFKETDTVVWKRGSNQMKVGDTIYVYIGNPLKTIKYKCCIIDEENKYAKIGDYENNHKYMELKLIEEYSIGVPLEKIKELGIYMIRKQSRLDSKLEDYIEKLEQSVN